MVNDFEDISLNDSKLSILGYSYNYKATYSSELCDKLLAIYAKEDDLVYDPFMGTGTTAVSCKRGNLKYLGSEIDQSQVDYANQRVDCIIL